MKCKSFRERTTDRQTSEVGRLIKGFLPRSDFDRGRGEGPKAEEVCEDGERNWAASSEERTGARVEVFSFCTVFLGADSGLVSLGASYYSSLRNSVSPGGCSPSDGRWDRAWDVRN